MTQTQWEAALRGAVRRAIREGLLSCPGGRAAPTIPVGVSNRHVHLDRRAMDALFGPGSELTHKKDLGQPGQYAAEETVTLKGPKGTLERVRVLGPLRERPQVEILVGDGFAIGVNPPVRESGQLAATPGITLLGPKGSIQLPDGVIAALRHIHMSPEDALRFGVADRQMVRVALDGIRGGVLHNTVVRVSDRFALELHVDTEEANALGIQNGDRVRLSVSG